MNFIIGTGKQGTAMLKLINLIQKGERIVPIEVKSGNSGSMQSMRLFMEEKRISKGIRISTENFSQLNDIDIYPIYSSCRLLSSHLAL